MEAVCVVSPDRLGYRLRIPFFEPPREGIPAHPENAADGAFRAAFVVGLDNLLFFFLGIAFLLWIEHKAGGVHSELVEVGNREGVLPRCT